MAFETILVVITAFAAILTILFFFGAWRWRSATKAMHARLEAGRLNHRTQPYRVEELNGLPPPVQRYFRTVLKDGQPIIAAVHLKQAGKLNLSETGDSWRAFAAAQRVITRRPGFDWDAAIAMIPGLPVRVHDAYIAGEGILHASLLGLVTLAQIRGTPEAAQGELMRFLAEAVWYPTALLPSQGVQWEEVDGSSAKATFLDGQIKVTLLMRFNGNGFIEQARCESRGRATPNGVVPTPWEGRISRYERVNGICIPLEAEAAWILPQGRRPYWRGRITELSYEFAQWGAPPARWRDDPVNAPPISTQG